MKRKVLFLSMLLVFTAAVSAPALAETADSTDLTVFDPPLTMDGSWELGDAEGEPDPTLPAGYAVADLWQGDRLYFGVYRSGAQGTKELLFCLDGNREYADTLNYVPDSYAQSGEMYLYFMLIEGDASRYSLYCYDIARNSLDLLLDGCSVNLVFLQNPPDDYEGLGYLLYEDAIVAIDAKTKQIAETVSFKDLGGLPEIGGSFQSGSLRGGARKYTYLTAEDNGRILLNTIVTEDGGSAAHTKYCTLYDVQTKQIADQWEAEGEY